MIRRLAPDVRTISRAAIRSCLLGYIGYGWTGLIPAACRNAMVLVPINVAPWLWGWPDRFRSRMNGAASFGLVIAGGRWREICEMHGSALCSKWF